jgi:hypothetical protein
MANILVTTTTADLADSIFEKKLDGVEMSQLFRKSWDPHSAERVFYISVELASSVATNLFASWLWDKIKQHRAKKIEIDGQECPHSETEIAALIEQILDDSQHTSNKDL